MTGPTSYIPKPGEAFDAIVIGRTRSALGSPFVCKTVRDDVVTALDAGGNIRKFSRMDFVFKEFQSGEGSQNHGNG